ncbi:MAG: chalcone isomerase family protein [Bacteroidetes bacterium]|nr:chalcone isomerase family protein [Bacteroidota bacterium]
MKKLIGIAFLFVSVFTNAQDIQVSGASFKKKLAIQGEVLSFNGAGLRQKYGFDLYVGAMYLKDQSADANKIINADEMQAINIKIISSKVTRDKFNESVAEGFAKASHGKATEEQKKMFKSYFSNEIKNKDDILLIYKPEKGIAVMINGQYKGIVGNLDFKKALWSIWLGTKPADEKLKKKMLGKV